MENDNPVTQTPVAKIPEAPVPQAGESNKIIMWFVMGLVVIVILVGGAYLFLSKQQPTVTNQTPLQPVVQAPKPQETVDALDKDLSDLNVANSDSDFSLVDQDLKQL